MTEKVLITGGTGSLGRVLAHMHKDVIIFSRNATKQQEMKQSYPDFQYILGDVRDRNALEFAMADADVIYHTAALKYVPECEEHPREAYGINVRGAHNVVGVAKWLKKDNVMNISTDKVVNPVGVYGRTKKLAEDLFRDNGFPSCRFGNYIGSDGSVIPLFRKQAHGGEITMTDGAMVRYWITLDRAAQYAIDMLKESKGGEVYIPKMSLIRLDEIIELVAPGANKRVIGLRPGEKIEEDLMTNSEWARVNERAHDYVINKPAEAIS